MGASMIYNYSPNRKVVDDTTNSTTYHTVPGFPALDPGAFCQSVTLQSIASGGGAGSVFYGVWNTSSTPSDDTTSVLIPSGSVFVIPGDVHRLIIRKTAASDAIVCTALF